MTFDMGLCILVLSLWIEVHDFCLNDFQLTTESNGHVFEDFGVLSYRQQNRTVSFNYVIFLSLILFRAILHWIQFS